MNAPLQTAHRLALLQDKPAGQLLIHEIYRSLQGESTWAGLPCIFVRTAVCDSRCTWCDTPHAFNQGETMSVGAVIAKVLEIDCPLVEVTGGEPLLQAEVLPLMARLADAGRTVLLETSGAHDIGKVDPRVHIIMDVKCPDSGECENNHWGNLDLLKPKDEIKLVIASKKDFDWATATVIRHNLIQRCALLVSPVFGSVTPLQLAEWVLGSGMNIRMQLQLHKLIWDPKERGV